MMNNIPVWKRFFDRFLESWRNTGSAPERIDYVRCLAMIQFIRDGAPLVEVGKVLAAAEQLFWGSWKERMLREQAAPDSGPQDPDLDTLFLLALGEVEAMLSGGLTGVPDYPLREADNPEQFWTMAARFYVSAARAIALVGRFGPYHEDAELRLRESTRLGKLLGAGRNAAPMYWSLSVTRAQAIGLEQLALIEAQRDHFSDAMGFYADALDCLIGSLDEVNGDDELLDLELTVRDALLSFQRDGWPMVDEHQDEERMIAQSTPDLLWSSTQGLLNRQSGVNWSQVITDTTRLIANVRALSTWYHDPDDPEELADWINRYGSAPPETIGVTIDGQGQERDLIPYLLEFRGQAAGRLGPDEYRTLRAADQAGAAEDRLRTYFFPDGLWEWGLTDNARNALISADRELFADTGLTEQVFDLLQQATEDLCQEVVWAPLEKARPALLRAANEALGMSVSTPSAPHYAWACRERELREQLAHYELNPTELQFLTGPKGSGTTPLPDALDELRRRFRTPARHVRKAKFARDQVAQQYFWFVGANKDGILPRLARIRRKMRRQDAEGAREAPSGPTKPSG